MLQCCKRASTCVSVCCQQRVHVWAPFVRGGCLRLCTHARSFPGASATILHVHAHGHASPKASLITNVNARVCVCVFVCEQQRETERERERGTIMLLMTEPDAGREEEGEGECEKKLSMFPIWKASPPNEVVQNHPIDNKANFYGSDKYVIMFSGAFQILSQSINHTDNFPSPI